MTKRSSRRNLIVGKLECENFSGALCRKRPVGGRCEGVDRNLDLLVKELQRYRVALAGVQAGE